MPTSGSRKKRSSATSQGFAYNFGRVLSALGSVHTATLTAYFAQGIAPQRIELEAFPKAGATLGTFFLPDLRAAYGTTVMLLVLAIVAAMGMAVTLAFRPTTTQATR